MSMPEITMYKSMCL